MSATKNNAAKAANQALINMMVTDQDKVVAAKTTRHASFKLKSAQQNAQSASGISAAMKIGLGLGALIVLAYFAISAI